MRLDKNSLSQTSANTIIVVMTILVMLVVATVIHSNYRIINSDGILYIEAAKQLAAGDWRGAMGTFRWPFYSALIALAYYVTGLDFQLAAHGLTVIFWSMTAAGVMTLVKTLGGKRLEVLLAGVLVVTSPYLMESLPPMIVRDHGLGAFHVWSVVFFLRFCQRQKLSDAMLWGGFAAVAVLFRIEAITYFVLLPMLLWVESGMNLARKVRLYCKANLVLVASVLAVLALLALDPKLSLQDLGRLHEPATIALQVYAQLQQGLAGKAEIYANQVLGEFIDDYALAGLVLTLLLVLVTKAALSAGWVQLFGALFAARRHDRVLAFKESRLLHWLLLLGMINAAFILIGVFVLSGRYVLPVSFVMMVYAAFGLAELTRMQLLPAQTRKIRLFAMLLVAGLVLQACYILWPPGQESRYEIKAANWVAANTPPGSRLYFSHKRTRYYFNGDSSSRDQDSWETVQRMVEAAKAGQYDYMIVHLSGKHPEQGAFLSGSLGEPLATFAHRNKYVAVFEVKRAP